MKPGSESRALPWLDGTGSRTLPLKCQVNLTICNAGLTGVFSESSVLAGFRRCTTPDIGASAGRGAVEHLLPHRLHTALDLSAAAGIAVRADLSESLAAVSRGNSLSLASMAAFQGSSLDGLALARIVRRDYEPRIPTQGEQNVAARIM